MRDQVSELKKEREQLKKSALGFSNLERELERSNEECTAMRRQLQALATENQALKAELVRTEQIP
eukprot:CAMPEP_0182450704 /NCGR_PEP_ID=MMETSP1172-20130603/43062_1 /TAXON_ID=708627 /ORGANISM="Timspurckia oligopyrenoides, Strain CCMP3278" /LENGTH=64 /DNA_ID=CAMNT_0024648405 /DNA_START=581 /DNA_END=775 /DNA_ORIENTATION=+